ncbi:MAG TPA: ABC transporter ATP-binding protein [Dehalococcoidia bacterium]|nr:ABC transporter ATP-binding protein [Dehalococcoidia bacterium]
MTISFLDEDRDIGRVYDTRLLRRLGGYVRPYAWLLVVSVVLLLTVTALEMAGPLIVKAAIDTQITAGRTDRLAFFVWLYVGSLVAAFALRFAMIVATTFISQRVMLDMRLQIFGHLQRMSIAYFDRNPIGRLVTRVTNDIATLEQALSQGVVTIITNLLMVGAILVILVALSWQLALFVLGLMPPLIWAVRYFAYTQRDGYRDQRLWLARINSYLAENIAGVAVVQLFNRRRENMRRFDQRNRGYFDANMRVLLWYAVFEPTVIIFGALTSAVIIWYGGGQAVRNAVTIGTLVAFLRYTQQIYAPLRDLADRYTTVQAAMAAVERIFGVLDEPEEIVDPPDPVHLTNIRGRIEFRDVWFAYDADNWVLRGLSFTIEPGERVAIVGATGAGKSTTMALLSRFYDIQRGEILVDGVPITRIPQRELRRHVGTVLQDPFIFTDTVVENIRLRDRSITRARVEEAARIVGAAPFVESLPDGYDTMLAEHGANLSTGQKQLLALARVAAFNPQIVLVLDEATASIDPETEATLQRSIARVSSGRTSLIIAHRLNTIRSVDRILVLQHDQLAESGTHEELLAQQGIYARLYRLQYRDQDSQGMRSA